MPYLTPEELPEEDVCRPLLIPASTDWLAIVSGALDELTKSYNWEQFGAVTVEEAVARMQALVDQYYEDLCDDCTLPGGGGILRLNDAYQVEQLINGEWVTPETIYIIPPPTERTDPTSEERICLAARNAANMLEQYYEEITDAFTLGLTVLEAIVAVAAFVGAAVVAPLGLVVAALGAIAYGSFRLGYNIVEFVTSDFWDTDFTHNFTCALIRCATDTGGVITFDFDCVNTELINQIEWLDPTISSYTLAGQVRWVLSQIGSDGLNAMGGTTEITEPDCTFCEDMWCYQWDLTVDVGNWEIYPGQPGFIDGAGINTGLVYVGGDPSRGRQQTIVQMVEDLTAYDITAALFYVHSTVGNTSAAGLANGVYKNAFANVISPITTPVTGDFPISTDVAPGNDVTSLQAVFAVGGCDGCGDPGGHGEMYLIVLQGTGVRPVEFFGGEDCP